MGSKNKRISLNNLEDGKSAIILKLRGDKVSNQRFMALGFVRGQEISLETKAPMGDPRVYAILGYRLSIRNDDARNILVSQVKA